MEKELVQEYERWEYLWEHGGSDPFYDDAVNLNLIRNHISYWKRMMEEEYGPAQGEYPAVYFRELPPEIGKGYMVKAAEIRDRAAEVLDTYLADSNFQYLLCHKKNLTEREAKETCIANVLGYTQVLSAALKEDDLVAMRRHVLRPETYLESFAGCAEKVRKIISKKAEKPTDQIGYSQMTLSEFGLGMGQIR